MNRQQRYALHVLEGFKAISMSSHPSADKGFSPPNVETPGLLQGTPFKPSSITMKGESQRKISHTLSGHS